MTALRSTGPRRWRLGLVTALVGALAAGGAVALADPTGPPVDVDPCTGPPGEYGAYTPGWQEREAYNVYCSWQGNVDRDTNPAFWAAYADMLPRWMADEGRAPLGNDLGNLPAGDPFRYPATKWAGKRGQYRHVWIPGPKGARMSAELFAPLPACSGRSCKPPPTGVRRHAGPHPIVTFLHGGGAQKEPWWFIAEALAEAGYVVLLFDAYGQGGSTAAPAGGSDPAYLVSARAALDYVVSTPRRATRHKGVNPFWRISDRSRMGVGGQSLGAITMNYVAQVDKRVDAVVAFDSCEGFSDAKGGLGDDYLFVYYGCTSDPTPLKPAQLRTPLLQLQADGTLVGTWPQPQPNDPHHKDAYYRALRERGIETMQVNFRAASHNDSAFIPGPGPFTQTRFGQVAHIYYTKAWFDYQLKGTRRGGAALRADACRRLTARTFDRTGDAHSIGTGWFDAGRAAAAGDVVAGNVPPTINGLLVKDRLSYLYLSGYYLERGRVRTDDMRTGGPVCSTR